MPAPSILLAGDFDAADPGHEAVMGACGRALPGFSLVAVSSDPLTTTALHGWPSVDRADRSAVGRAAGRADALVIAGAPVFAAGSGTRAGTRRLTRALALALAVTARGRPVALLGVGGGPLGSGLAPLLARQLVRQADLLVLRDHAAARALASAGAPAPFRVGADPAWTWLGDPPDISTPVEDVVTVVVSDRPFGAMVSGPLAVALDAVLETGLAVRLLPWRAGAGGRADRELTRRIAERLGWRATLLPAVGDLREARASIAGSRAVVALPYHAQLAAASAGVPCVALEAVEGPPGLGHPLAWRSVSIGADPLRIAAAIIRQASSPAPSQAAVRERIAAAGEGFRLLRLLLHGGRSTEGGRNTDLELAPVAWDR